MEFKAIIKKGRFRYIKRKYNATDETTLEDTLLSKNIPVVEVVQNRKDKKLRRVGKKYLLQFFGKLRICYAINMPILETLELCENVIPNKNLKKTLAEIKQQIEAGVELSSCLWRYPNIFPPVICRLVEVGYRSGKMKEACDKIFYMLNISLQTRRKVISAMYYPDITLLPQIAPLFHMTMDDLFDFAPHDEPLVVVNEYHFGLSLEIVDKRILDYGIAKECNIYKVGDTWEVRFHFVSTREDIPHILQKYIKQGVLIDGYSVRIADGKIISDNKPNKCYICTEKIWEYNIADRKYLKAMLDEQVSMGLIDEDDL